MTQKSLSFVSGRDLRDAGMHTAVTHAAVVDADWPEKALQSLREYLFFNRDVEFMAEDVRAYAYSELLLAQPPHCRAWGAIMLRAAREGLIRRVRLAPVKTASSHRANASVWRAA